MPLTLAEVCASLDSGRLSHDSFVDFCQQMRAEGRKRVDSFVFEHGFETYLGRTCATARMTMSLGWLIGYDREGNYRYWFKLSNDSDDWNAADIALEQRILKTRKDDRIVKAVYDAATNVFHGCTLDRNGWSQWEDIRSLLRRLVGRDPRGVRNMNNARSGNIQPALTHLGTKFGAPSRRSISIRRRFINGIVSPYLHNDPSDMDALVLAGGGALTCVEFKRKYPARGRHKYFGVDEVPHVANMRLLADMGIPMLHVLLVAPRWNDVESPVGWLSDETSRANWTWLVGWLDEVALVPGVDMSTKGDKSGQRSFTRMQRAYDWRCLRKLHEGVELNEVAQSHLASFLQWSGTSLSGISYEGLKARTTEADPCYP